jgi:hypothetical protein
MMLYIVCYDVAIKDVGNTDGFVIDEHCYVFDDNPRMWHVKPRLQISRIDDKMATV